MASKMQRPFRLQSSSVTQAHDNVVVEARTTKGRKNLGHMVPHKLAAADTL